MDDYSNLLNWKLLYGSHDFPGPDGGTCINEAAIVAAGFAYRRVGHPKDLPTCFCPVVGEFSVWLNDSITDTDLRMKLLLPFVTRLAGTKGTAEDQKARIDALRGRLLAVTPARHHRRRFTHRHQGHLLLGEAIGRWTVRRFSIRTASNVRELIRIAEFVRGGLEVAQLPEFYASMAGALEAMLRIGPKATPPEAELLIARMEMAKAAARSTSSRRRPNDASGQNLRVGGGV
jgi:hypothetical protein